MHSSHPHLDSIPEKKEVRSSIYYTAARISIFRVNSYSSLLPNWQGFSLCEKSTTFGSREGTVS